MINDIKNGLEKYSTRIYEISFLLRAHKREPGEISVDNLITALSKGSSNMIRDLKGYYEQLLEIADILKSNGYNPKELTIQDLIKDHLN